MKRLRLIIFLVIFGASLNLNAQDLLQYIPNDVTLLAGINPNRMKAKVDMERIKKMDFYEYIMDEMDREMGSQSEMAKQFFIDPAKYGLGVYDESYIFLKMNDDKSTMINYIFALTDEAAFKSFLEEEAFAKKKRAIKKVANYSVIEDDEATVAWTNKVVLITSAQDMKGFDGEDLKDFKGHIREAVNKRVATVMGNTKANSILSNPSFLKAGGTVKSDAFMWMDYGYIAQFQEAMGVNQDPLTSGLMEKMMGMYDDNYLLMGLNFLNGEARLDTKYLVKGELAGLMAGMTDNSMNPRFARYLSKDVLGYYGLSLNIEKTVRGMAKMLAPMFESQGEMPDVDQMVEQGVAAVGLDMSAAEVYNIFEGDMLLTISGLREFEKEVTTYEYDEDFNRKEVKKRKKESLPGFTAMMTYNDENALMPLIQMGIDAGVISKNDTYYNVSIPSSPMDMYLTMNKGILFFTNDVDLMGKKRLKKGLKKSERLGKQHLSSLVSNSQVIFWDINKTLAEFGDMAGAMGGPEGDAMVNLFRQNMKDMWITSGKMKNGMIDTDMVFNFTNTKVNSLDQIFQMINDVYISFVDEKKL